MPNIPNNMMLGCVVAFALGAALAWLYARARMRALQATFVESMRRLEDSQANAESALNEHRERVVELTSERATLAGRLERLMQAESDLATARADVKHWNEACQRAEQRLTETATRLDEQKQSQLSLERLREEDEARFKVLAGDALDTNSRKFAEQNQTNLGTLLNPLREQLGDFRKTVAEVYDKESRERQLLKVEIDSLKNLNQRISEDAINLTHALKSDSKARGTWGEVILARLLEMAGLQEGRQYETQRGFSTSEGGRQQHPDVIVRLPDEKDIVIDSKVSLVGWNRYVSATNDDERSAALREHLTSVRRHVDGLSGKDYCSLPGLRTLDFVLMFVPIEAAFVEAVRTDDGLYGYALAKKVSLVSPSTLLATLQTVGHLWRLQQRSVNALEFSKAAALLHDNFALLVEGIQDVGDKLDRAKDAHGGLLRRLTEGGRGSVLLQVQRLKELGAQAKKSLSPELLERAGSNGALESKEVIERAQTEELQRLDAPESQTGISDGARG